MDCYCKGKHIGCFAFGDEEKMFTPEQKELLKMNIILENKPSNPPDPDKVKIKLGNTPKIKIPNLGRLLGRRWFTKVFDNVPNLGLL